MRAERFARYAAWGWAIAPAPPGQKGPRCPGWNRPGGYLTDPEAVRRFFARHPDWNAVLVHGPSGTAALDLDHTPWAARAFRAVGIELGALFAQAPYRVRGRRGEKPFFRVPPGLDLPPRKLTWPLPDGGEVVVFELRAGPVGEVLPPSIHPETRRPYRWTREPQSAEAIPWIPPALLEVWRNWEAYLPRLQRAAPWPLPEPRRVPPVAALEPARVSGERVRRYARAALEAEAARVARTPEGGRNNQLNRSAFTLGGWVAHGALRAEEVVDALLAAARAAGLGEREALATIHSGLRAGVRRPHRLEGRFRKGGAA